jgi:DNA-binding NtrC family response regulator
VDVQVFTATHRDLESAAREERFRQDLFYRINVIIIKVPPLRERVDEILPLAEFFLHKYAPHASDVASLMSPLRDELQTYEWPGNVRELENAMRRLLVFEDPQALLRDLKRRRDESLPRPQLVQSVPANPNFTKRVETGAIQDIQEAKDRSEANLILSVLKEARWNRRQAATLLGLSYKTLLYRINKYGIN